MQKTFFSLFILCSLTIGSQAQTVNSDFWAATDGLGREIGRYDNNLQEKTVIMFYWTWHQRDDAPGTKVKNTSQIIRENPEARWDKDHPAWKEHATGNYFWEEPLLGYYRATDKWVLRKHAEMLADAKVDAVMFDCTNGSLTWDLATDSLLEVWDQAQKDGVKVPKIGFLLPFGAAPHSLVSLRHLYEKYYSKNLYRNLWFFWEGKPCIMAYPDNLTESEEDRAIRNFFTFRPGQPDYVTGPTKGRNDQWGWLENYPQKGYVKLQGNQYELVTVGVAQNAGPETNGHCSAFNLPGTFSRSFSQRMGYDPRPEGYLFGWNFSEQWERAYEINPKAVFITGWNEWIAGKYDDAQPWTGKPFSFVDEFDWDHSRDIEPVKAWGERGDSYYLQLVDRVRKFKGTETCPVPCQPANFKFDDWKSWNNVQPYFPSYKGNTRHRNSKAVCDLHYINNSGRNDIVGARVAQDSENIYFYVETAEALTSPDERNWMMLFLDADRNKTTGWQGYDYVVNYQSPKGKKAFVQKSFQNKWIWKDAGCAQMKKDNNRLVLKIPRRILGLQSKPLNFEFKWSDNMQDDGNIMDFYVNGDAAPGGRFNFIFSQR